MPVPPEEHPVPSPEAERIYARAIVDLLRGKQFDLAALCNAHPEHAAALRRLHEEWQQVRAQRSNATLADRLRSRFGPDADPNVSLQGAAEPASDFSSEVMARLAGRQPTSSRYKLEGEVARGGMGAILRVWDEDLRRHLAMKVVLGQSDAPGQGATPEVAPSTLARFLEEAQVTGQLDHPGIVPVHELGLDAEGRVYFTMKLVKGKTLKAVFDELAAGQGGWTQTRVLGLLLRVCEAMAYAHDKQVIHRDLKPANVMVGKFGEVYVMDWGLAKILGRPDERDLRVRSEPVSATAPLSSDRGDRAGESPDSPLYTMDGEVVGTPAYMSPEQAAGKLGAMGPHSDVYALGAMLYHLLAGHMPYAPPGVKMNNYALWQLVQCSSPEPLGARDNSVSVELTAICEKAMAREIPARYATMFELAADLSAYLEGRVVRAYETGAWAETRKWVQRNRRLAAALLAAVAVLVAGLISSLVLKSQSDANLLLAERNAQQAQEQRDIARAETAKVLRLSDAKVLQELEREADGLWPPYPEHIPALESWLERTRVLVARLPDHRASLAKMRTRARPWSTEERARDRAQHPLEGELAKKQVELDAQIAQLEQGLTGQVQLAADARLVELESELAALTAQVESRGSWSFDTPGEGWQHGLLEELIGNLESLDQGLLADDASTPEGGWSVPKRLDFARDLQRGFAKGGEYERAWAAALPDIAVAYPGLDLKPQLGLLPIGADPRSGLWEFAHLLTGAVAERGASGNLAMTERTGVVLVLLPGGTFLLGAQDSDPAGPNYDPQVQSDEGPMHEVQLAPFLLAKYEMTQGQWVRLTGHNPSAYGRHNWNPTWLSSVRAGSLLHPMESIRWTDCMTWLPRAGLELCSEAQWECGARGGTTTPWWTGSEKESLEGAANLADRYAQMHDGDGWWGHELWLDDGATVHAPVGSYAPNPFGLHDVVGNLWEWCLDGYGGAYGEPPIVNPGAPWGGAASNVIRGGSFDRPAIYGRSDARSYSKPTTTAINLGVRPALRLAE